MKSGWNIVTPIHLFIVFGWLWALTAELNSWDRNYMAYQAKYKYIYYLATYLKKKKCVDRCSRSRTTPLTGGPWECSMAFLYPIISIFKISDHYKSI
jgi:hypothetical protein